MTTEEPCSICGAPKDDHGGMNHEFNLHNQLIPKSPTRPTPRAQQPIFVVGAIDTSLRKLLLDKGIISHEDLASLFSAGAGTEGDRATGQAESP